MGGNAVPGVGAIHITEINPTLRKIEQDLDLPANMLDNSLLGSVGKKEYSGDIDIVMDPVSDNELTDFFTKLRKLYGQFNVRRAGHMFNVSVPIEQYDNTLQDRKPRTGTVQVDFIFADVEYTKFFNYSPGDSSKYKGVHRNLAISAVSGFTDRKVSDELDGYDRPVSIQRWKFGGNGFVRINRFSRKDKNDNWIKSQKDEEIGTIKKDPLLIAEILFGDTASVSDLDSLESIIAACKRYFDIDKQHDVFNRIAFNIKEYNERSEKTNLSAFGVPDEILPYMEHCSDRH